MRGRQQTLVRAGDVLPLLLISFPRGRSDIAEELEKAYTHTLRGLQEEILAPYTSMLAALPAVVVVLLRAANPCDCLGHHHPPGTESRLTRRLAADLGSRVGEIDLAYDSIRRWSPQPLSSLAAGVEERELAPLHFHAALLAVLLHELQHLAFPEHSERQVRGASNTLYSQMMEQLVLSELGAGYGMSARA
jgi:hypothetical protein